MKAPVRFYLRSGRNPNATDSRSRTLLLLAAKAGQTDICRLLIESGADPTLRDADGNDALSAATRNRHAEAAGVLRACLARLASPPAPSVDHARTDGDSSGIASLPKNVASDLGGDDWEAEPVASPPPDDEALRRSTTELQNGISAHAPIDADHAWEDVEIDLPESAARPDPAHAVWLDEVRSLIHYGLSWGWVTRHQVDEIAGLNRAGEGRDEVEINLRLVLGEVGIVVDEAVGESTIGRLWRDWQAEPPNEDGHSGVIDEAVAFLEAPDVLENPLNYYWRDIRRLEAESSRRLRASGQPPGSRGHMNSR